MSSPLSFSTFLPLASPFPNLLALKLPSQNTTPNSTSRSRPTISEPSNPVLLTSNSQQIQSRPPGPQDDMSVFGAQAFTMMAQPPLYSAPPPVYKPSTLSIQQSPLRSHPLPILPPPPSYKRSPSPSPSTSSQPSLHELPKYTPRASISTTESTSTPKPQPNLNSWSAWNPFNWTSASERNQCTTGGSTSRGRRDPMAGERGAELDAHEQYEINHRREREREDKDGEWCCGCFWAGPPLPTAAYYIF